VTPRLDGEAGFDALGCVHVLEEVEAGALAVAAQVEIESKN